MSGEKSDLQCLCRNYSFMRADQRGGKLSNEFKGSSEPVRLGDKWVYLRPVERKCEYLLVIVKLASD